MVTKVTADSEYIAERIVDYSEATATGEIELYERQHLKTITLTDEEGKKYTVKTRDIINSDIVSSADGVDMVVGIDHNGYGFKDEVKEMTQDEIDGSEIEVQAKYDGRTGWGNSTETKHHLGEEVTLRIEFV